MLPQLDGVSSRTQKRLSAMAWLAPSFNDNGHLCGVKEWVWLSQLHRFHTHAHYLLAQDWYNEKWSIITLRPFHRDLTCVLCSLSAGHKIIFTCIQKFCPPPPGWTSFVGFAGSIYGRAHASAVEFIGQACCIL